MNRKQSWLRWHALRSFFESREAWAEAAPILGLSDVIVDIVETGKTLKENGLAVLETVCPISARLVANPASFRFKAEETNTLVQKLAEQVEQG